MATLSFQCYERYSSLVDVSVSDVDECELGIANCEENTMCYNTPGSFLCGCLRGFVTGEDGCEDVDECDEEKNGDNRCGENSNCTNTPGSYNCACKEGFQGDGVICIGKESSREMMSSVLVRSLPGR